MPDMVKVIKGLEICSDCGFCESIKKFDLRCPYRNNDGKGCDRSQLLMDALELLKEQDDLGKELTNAVELIHKKNERIKKLEEQIETLTRWRANAGAFD